MPNDIERRRLVVQVWLDGQQFPVAEYGRFNWAAVPRIGDGLILPDGRNVTVRDVLWGLPDSESTEQFVSISARS